jgi:alpha-1,2-mannosyltransferase
MRSIFDRPLFLLGAFASLLLAANEVRFETRMPLGGDLSQIWLAGYLVDRGDFATLYVPTAFSSAGQGLIELFYHPQAWWSYPPTTLLLGCPLALLSYPVALALFSVLQACLAAVTGAVVTDKRLPRAGAIAIALFSPALLLSLVFGQFSVPVACFLVLGVFALPKRPALAGLLFGLTAVKPQFGALLPLALAAGGEWRAFASAALTVAGLCLGTAAAFGSDVWLDFVTKTLPQQAQLIGDLLNYGAVGHSVRDTLLLAGTPRPLAGAVQAIAALIATLATASAFKRTSDPHLRAFVLGLAAVTLLPHANIYDAAIPAMGALALYGSEKPLHPVALTAVFVTWLSPTAHAILGFFGCYKFAPMFEVLVLAVTLFILERAAWDDRRGAESGSTTGAIAA